MALHFTLKISGTEIGDFYARRTAGTPTQDSIGTYDVILTGKHFNLIWAGTVEHRYGDGAWALIARAITAAGLDGEADRG